MKKIIILSVAILLVSSMALYAQDLKFTYWAKSNIDYVRVITNTLTTNIVFLQIVFVTPVGGYKCIYYANNSSGYQFTRAEAFDLAERIKRGRIKGAGHYKFGSGHTITFTNPSGIGSVTAYRIEHFIFN